MVKSYLGERSREQWAARVLAFYKRAAPGTINDGDEHHAHYTCWKYKGKTEVLYRRLEKKYDIPVKQVHEWDDEVVADAKPTEEEEENLDEEVKPDTGGGEEL